MSGGFSDQFFIKGIIGGGYKPEANFHFSDLSPELMVELQKARPDLVKAGVEPEVATIIDALELSSDSWNPDDRTFTVQRWETGIDFLRQHGGSESDTVLNLYSGRDEPDPPSHSEILDLINNQTDRYIYRRQDRPNQGPDYTRNFALKLLYENPNWLPQDFDITDDNSIMQLMENADPEEAGVKEYFAWVLDPWFEKKEGEEESQKKIQETYRTKSQKEMQSTQSMRRKSSNAEVDRIKERA